MGLFDFLKRPKPAAPASPTVPASPDPPPLSDDARTLLAAIARDPKGELVKIRVPGQVVWDTNGRQFIDEKGPGKEQRWKTAVNQLAAADLIGPIGMSPYKLYLITDRGAELARGATAHE